MGNNEPNLLDWRETRSVEAMAYAYWMRSQLTRESGPAVPVRTAWINPAFFSTFGVAPMLGRTFSEDEDRSGGDVHKIVLSHDTWRTLYGADPGVLSRYVRLDNTEYEVSGDQSGAARA